MFSQNFIQEALLTVFIDDDIGFMLTLADSVRIACNERTPRVLPALLPAGGGDLVGCGGMKLLKVAPCYSQGVGCIICESALWNMDELVQHVGDLVFPCISSTGDCLFYCLWIILEQRQILMKHGHDNGRLCASKLEHGRGVLAVNRGLNGTGIRSVPGYQGGGFGIKYSESLQCVLSFCETDDIAAHSFKAPLPVFENSKTGYPGTGINAQNSCFHARFTSENEMWE